MRGNFETRAAGPLSRLSEDQLAFLRLFVTSRGNLSDIERTLGVSYPTVRSKLDDLIGAMEEPATESQPAPSHMAATIQRPRPTPSRAPPPSQSPLPPAQHRTARDPGAHRRWPHEPARGLRGTQADPQ